MGNGQIFIATSNRILREGIGHLLSEHEIYEDSEVFGSLEDVFIAMRACLPAVVVLAEPLFELPIVAVARKVKEILPSARIVALQRRTSRCFPAQLFRSGAFAVLCGHATVAALKQSINEAKVNRCYISEQVAECLVLELSASGGLHHGLSERELEIFVMLVKGYSRRLIAQCLSTNPRAISSSESAIKARLNVTNVSEMVQYAVRFGLVVDTGETQKLVRLCGGSDTS